MPTARGVSIKSGDVVLLIGPDHSGLAYDLASTHPEARFLVYEYSTSKSRSPSRFHEPLSSLCENVKLIQTKHLDRIGEEVDAVDVLVFEPQAFLSLVSIMQQMLVASHILRPGGTFYLVTHKRAGAKKLQEYLADLYAAPVRVADRWGGGHRLLAVERDPDLCLPDKSTTRESLLLHILGIELFVETEPSLFSYTGLDTGTRVLLENVDLHSFSRAMDLGCGWGAVGLVAASVNSSGEVVMVDNDPRATRVAYDNVVRLGLQERVSVVTLGSLNQVPGSFDLVLSNPPFHVADAELTGLFRGVHYKLHNGGLLFAVVHNSYRLRFERIFSDVFGNILLHYSDGITQYTVLRATKRPSSYLQRE